ncbi:MAG: hypothetical protein IAF08_09570 [Rhizobacter sp.]|nr:hypothetical protein [Chlorobiales bacterium]
MARNQRAIKQPGNLALTETQSKVFKFITRFTAEHKKPPTVREIAAKMNYASTNAVSDVLKVLAEKRYIVREAGSRGITVTYQDELEKFGFGSPALDRVALVPLMEVDTTVKDNLRPRGASLYIDKNLTGGKDCFLAIVSDDGMDRAGLLKGDLVLVERRAVEANEKSILVAAASSDELIVRSYQFTNGRVRLLAANASYSEKMFKPSDKFSETKLLGVVRLMVRRLMPM